MLDKLAIVYALYAVISVGLTVWLARMLSASGKVFLEDVFTDHSLANAVNRLLVVGFYLVNLGYACLLLDGGRATDLRSAIETLAGKLGALLLSLAVMHFMNMFIFHRIRRRVQRGQAAPLPPSGRTSLAPSGPAAARELAPVAPYGGVAAAVD